MSGCMKCSVCGAAVQGDAPHGLCPRCVLQAGLETAAPSPPASGGPPEDGRPAVPPVSELAPHFPQLALLEFIQRGGMGWVYKARQPNLDRLVALKILPPDVAGDPAFAERFQREARALARLSHPSIVAIYDFGKAGPYYYFLMEYVDGANLRQLERSRQLSPEEAFAIVPRICEALQYAHDEGIVHRDVKPENILIDARGRVKIADFGIAKLVGQKRDFTLTGTMHALGTPHYMAPEQVEAPATVDHRADIYALGVVFYEMLTGELPLGRFDPPSRKLEVDVRVDEVVLKSLERSPERRYQTASAVKSDVEGLASGATPPSPPTARIRAPSGALPPGQGALDILGQAWRQWWEERARWFAITVQTVLLIGHVVCLLGFFGVSIKSVWEAGGHRQLTYAVGVFDPWYTYETYPTPTTPFRFVFHPAAGSVLFLIAGLLLALANWRIEKARKPDASRWSAPGPVAAVWALWAAVAVGMGLYLGHQALEEKRLGGGLLAPELRTVMDIRGDEARERALADLARKAARAGDGATTLQAVRELRGDEVHDRIAAECAVRLAAVMQGRESRAGEEGPAEVAREIRIPSLQEDTLAKVAALSSPADSRESGAEAARDGRKEELIAAAGAGDVSRVVELLDADVSVNDKSADGRTALIAAIAGGHRSLALTLILLGADLTERDHEGKTALMHAAERGGHTFLSTLPQLFQISYEEDAGRRKELLAALPGVDRSLLQGRAFDLARLNTAELERQTDGDGETASVKAARAGDWAAFRLVATTIESLRARGKDGRTATMHFAAQGVREPFERLRDGWTFGKTGGEAGFVGEMLILDVDQLALTDSDGKSALMLAREGGHEEVADILWRHLETLVRNETEAIEKGDADVRKHLEARSLAWRALGEEAKAMEDHRRSREP